MALGSVTVHYYLQFCTHTVMKTFLGGVSLGSLGQSRGFVGTFQKTHLQKNLKGVTGISKFCLTIVILSKFHNYPLALQLKHCVHRVKQNTLWGRKQNPGSLTPSERHNHGSSSFCCPLKGSQRRKCHSDIDRGKEGTMKTWTLATKSEIYLESGFETT